MRGKRYETEKKIRGGQGGNRFTEKVENGQNDHQPKITSQKLADEYGVGERTIRRNADFSKVVDILPEEVKKDVLSGEEKISRTTTENILSLDKPTQKKFLKEVESGTPIKEAVKIESKPIYFNPMPFKPIKATISTIHIKSLKTL